MFFLLLIFLNPMASVLGPTGGSINITKDGRTIATLTVKEGALQREIPLGIREIPPPPIPIWGWEPIRAFKVSPLSEVFSSPLELRISVEKRDKNAVIAYYYRDLYFPLAASRYSGGFLRTSIYHGGIYVVLKPNREMRIFASGPSREALLVIGDLIIDDTYPRIKEKFKKEGYKYPIWFFPLRPGETPLKASGQLSKELEKLHEKWGEFKLDVLAFGLGGLVAVGYLRNRDLYNDDFGNVLVTVGTPFKGSHLAIRDSLYGVGFPEAYFYLDVLGDYSEDYGPKGEEIEKIVQGKDWSQRGGFSRKKLKENVNTVNLRGQVPNPGRALYLPEMEEGDGLVSLSSGMLTPIEPEPFPLDHFSLLRSEEVLSSARDFLEFYHGWNWPQIFISVWEGELPEDTISTLWFKEASLHLRSPENLRALIEVCRNMLSSVPRNGILITNGDNDTYPGWYLQVKENFRKDVLIINRNLAWVREFVAYAKRKGLPIGKEKELTGDSLISYLAKEQDKRPVSFAITVYKPERYTPSLRLTGLVYRIGEDTLDIQQETERLLHEVYLYDEIRSIQADSLSRPVERMARNYQSLFLKMASVWEDRGELEKALRELDLALSFPKASPYVWFLRARLLGDMGKGSLATDSYLRALEGSGDNWNLILACAKPLLEAGKRSAVLRAVSRYLSRHPESKEAIQFLKSL